MTVEIIAVPLQIVPTVDHQKHNCNPKVTTGCL